MSNAMDDAAVAHPIAPRLTGEPKPHIGPAFKDYQEAHAATVGDGAKTWWAKVSFFTLLSITM
jgi:acetyl-CoA synthetase